jgi:TolA-binding protein
VARLEKRLADVDARLGLLLARDGGAPAQAPLRFDAPRGEQRAVDLGPAPPRDGTASIDIERPTPVIDEGPPIVDDGLVAPGDDDGGPDDGDAPRLVLRGAPAGRDNDGADDGAGDPLAAMQSAKDLYEWAQARRREGRLIEAIAGFEDVVGRFPRDDLADNAVYWTGLCHQLRSDHKLAISVWQKLPLRFPRSAKIPDALYGMGQSHEALGEPALAEALYDEVISSYPKAEKRSDARKALLRLRPLR